MKFKEYLKLCELQLMPTPQTGQPNNAAGGGVPNNPGMQNANKQRLAQQAKTALMKAKNTTDPRQKTKDLANLSQQIAQLNSVDATTDLNNQLNTMLKNQQSGSKPGNPAAGSSLGI